MRDSVGVVAILFTDLVGSTEVLDRLGDDAAEQLRRTHFSLLRGAVADADGTEVKSLGDGLMVTFASPVQALSCAVAMQRAIADHNRVKPGQALQVRVGLHAGDPVRYEDDVHGTAVVVAKRLCDRAGGGQILASELVTGLVGKRGDFHFRSAGRLKLKGLTEPTPAVTVEWHDPQPFPDPTGTRPPKGPGNQAAPLAARPLVGRDRELRRVHEALGEAAAGRGQMVFVVGPMGIGKTRLVEEALAEARRQDFTVLIGRTPAAGSGLAYAPLLSAFGANLRSLEPGEQDQLVGDLPHLGRLWPELRLPPPAPIQDAELERALLYEAVARLLERLSTRSPVLLFVDDLHWADAPSLSLLGYLISTVAASPIALAGTYRPEGILENKALRQFVTNARRAGTITELPLRGLGSDHVAEMAAGILGDAPPASVLELSARAAGTPLFVEALIRGLVDAGSLVRTDGGWFLNADHPTALPPSVQDLVVDRLDLLVPEERSTVELIAHGAQGLPHDVLERAGGLDSDELLTVVRRLGEAGLLVQEDDGPQVTYRLGHPLIQEVAAAELPAVASRRVHARLARTFEELRPRDLDSLAFHYRRAGHEVDRDRALEVLLAAGERARSLAAHEEAARHFGAALPLIRDGQRPELLAHVLERLGDSWEPLGENAAAMEVWTEAVDELERAGDVRGVARLHRRLALGVYSTGDIATAERYADAGINALRGDAPSDELFALHAARFLIAPPLDDPERARETSAQLMRLAESLGTVPAKTEALISGVTLLYIAGEDAIDPRNVAAQGQEALRIAEQAGDWPLARRAHRDLGWLALYYYDHATMRAHARAQIDIDRRLGDIAHQPASLFQLGYMELVAGNFEESLKIAEEAVASARRYDQRRSLGMCLAQLALTEIHRGDLDAAGDHLGEAQQVFPQLFTDPRGRLVIGWPRAAFALERGDFAGVRRAAGPIHPPMTSILVGVAQVLEGDLEGAVATQATLAARARGELFPAAMADRLLGLIEKARGEENSAREHLERSAGTLDTLALPFEAAVSRLHAGTKENVSQALVTFEALGAARDADKARRALRGLGVRLPSARSGRGTDQRLSRREMEVAGLVAEGLTNAEIAERLVLSVRTIESHLDHVYARLGMSSRAALARWVTESRVASGP
jgi:class 3 adenylate cyclase/DNA-binding CsgD family transcriptional regulator/tetratricopeptide (TPR) repeat protein